MRSSNSSSNSSSSSISMSGTLLLATSTGLIGLATHILTAEQHQQQRQQQLILVPLLLVPCLILSIVHWVGFELYCNN